MPVAWCDAQGLLLGANSAFAHWWGARPATDGATLASCLHLDDALARALRTGQGLPARLLRLQDAQGRAHLARLTVRRCGALQLVTLLPQDEAGAAHLAGASAVVSEQGLATGLPPDGHAGLLAMAQRLGRLGVWARDLRTGAGHWDPSMWQLFGMAPQARSPDIAAALLLMHPADRASVQQAYQRSVHQPGLHSCRYRVPRADGSLRHARTVWEVQADAQGQPAVARGIVVDETDTALLARRLELTTSAAGVGVWSLSVDGQPQGHWDPQMRRLHGLSDDEPTPDISGYTERCVHPDDRHAVGQALATLMARREGLLDLDLRIVLPGGLVRRLASRTAIESGPQGRQLHGVMFDVTERHSTEHRLREASERAALAARGAGLGTWESAPDGQLGWWDDQMFALRGLAPQPNPVTRQQIAACLHPEDREANSRLLDWAAETGEPTNTQFRVVWPDGTVRWLASRSSALVDEQGRWTRRIGINWDITDVRNAAQAQQDKLLAQRENQAKSRFLARMSHELRTPLHAVLGFAQLLLADGPRTDPATWQRRVQQVQVSGEHLLALIDDVLALSSVESGELPLRLQPVQLSPLVASTVALLEPQARRQQVQLRTEVAGTLAVQADPVRLRQVLLNLLSNAIKYNRPGGWVSVTAQGDGPAQRVLTVQDNGLGMAADQLAHLFEPFNRLGREQGEIAGNGIGLTIVRAAVQQMGGTVAVRSAPGAGSAFSVTLAAAAPPAQQASALGVDRPAAAATIGPMTTVLYIEDNEVNLLIVHELVQRRGDLRFVSACDGLSGLVAARSHRPALILLDMQLPDIDGHEVLRRLRADPETAGIQVVALSANAMPQDIRRALEAGCAEYWTKPLDLRAFMQAMDTRFGPVPP